MSRMFAFLLASAAGAMPALAVDLVLPLGYDTTVGNAPFLGPLTSSPRTYQLLIHADQLTTLVGSDLSGIAFRISASATVAWPAADTTYANYDIYLSASVAPADRSLAAFANNVAGPQTQVRSGQLVIPTGAYTFGSSPNAFGPEISFTTPWTYTGGHLLVEIRHDGSDGTSRSVDAVGTSASTGYGSLFSAAWLGNYTATIDATQGNFAIVRLTAGGGTSTCYANCDNSTAAPVLNVADFTCFLQQFAAGESYANCDNSTAAPTLNVADFTCFLQSFAAGCP